MHRFPTKPFLLLLLLALCGQALAAPCAGMKGAEMSGHQPMQAAEPMPAADHARHCDEEAMAGHCDGTAADNTDCNQTCSCCPGHCATALPAGDLQAAAPLRNTPATAYAEINSSPEPETAIRPPIHP